MTAFEFVFPLFRLLVGLSFAEMLSGLARSLKNKREGRVGWPTPLLGTLILINLTMFWQGLGKCATLPRRPACRCC